MTVMRDRVQARVTALGKSSITLAREVGLERGYINDFLIGRKGSLRGAKLDAVAAALDCDVAYLTGEQATPRAGQQAALPAPRPAKSGIDARLVPVRGVAEPGVWRELGSADEPSGDVLAPIDPRYPVDRRAFRVRGHHTDVVGISDGSAVVCLDFDAMERGGIGLRDGWYCVVRRLRKSLGLCETAIRRAEITATGVAFIDPENGNRVIAGKHGDDEVTIAGVVERTVQLFL